MPRLRMPDGADEEESYSEDSDFEGARGPLENITLVSPTAPMQDNADDDVVTPDAERADFRDVNPLSPEADEAPPVHYRERATETRSGIRARGLTV